MNIDYELAQWESAQERDFADYQLDEFMAQREQEKCDEYSKKNKK